MEEEEEKQCEKVWNDRAMDIAWTVVSYSRHGLCLPVTPCIAASFVLLHNYFAKRKTTKHRLYLLLCTSLQVACKILESYRTMDAIFAEFAKSAVGVTKIIPESIVQCALGPRDFRDQRLKEDEKKRVFEIEVDILDSVDWSFSFDLSFDHISSHGNIFGETNLEKDEIDGIEQSILRNLCLIMKSSHCIKLNQEIVAVASIHHALQPIEAKKHIVFSREIDDWMTRAKAINPQQFESICKYIAMKVQRVQKKP